MSRDEPWHPPPQLASPVTVPDALLPVVERLAEQAHDRWAAGRLAEGWTWGPERDDGLRQHPCLVAYADLPEVDREHERATARVMIGTLLGWGYRLEGPSIDAARSDDPVGGRATTSQGAERTGASDASGWEPWFEASAEALDACGPLGGEPVARELLERVALAGHRDSLVAFLRGLRREGHRALDPFRVERWVRDAAALAAEIPSVPDRSPLLRSMFGALEPDPGVRALALAGVLLDGRAEGDHVGRFDRELVTFWLDGTLPNGDPGQLGSSSARIAIIAALEAMRLLSDATHARRLEVVASWDARLSGALAKQGPLSRELADAWLAEARGGDRTYAHLIAARAGDRAALEALVAELRSIELACRESPEEPAALARWLNGAHRLGLIAALDADHGGLRMARTRLALRLLDHLDTVLDRGPVDLLDPALEPLLVRALAGVVRDRIGAFDAPRATAALVRYAEAGAFGGGSAIPLARLVRLVERELGEEVARSFLMRGTFQTMRRRAVPPERVVRRSDLARLLDAVADTESGRATRAWFEPTTRAESAETEAPTRDARTLVRTTRELAGAEWSAPEQTDLAAELAAASRFWSATHVAGPAGGEPSVRTVPRWARLPEELRRLSRTVVQPTDPASLPRATFALHLDLLRGRHGETYFLPRAFRATPGGLVTVARDARYAVPLDAMRSLDDARAAFDVLRRQAALGAAGRRHVAAVQDALERILTSDVRARLGGELASGCGAVELASAVPALPWELIRVSAREGGEPRPLALEVPVYRCRSQARAGFQAPRLPLRSILVLADRSHEGVDDEIDVLRAVFAREGSRIEVVDRAADVGAALAARAWDIVHYAGHQGPSADATPSLALAGGSVPVLELVDRTTARPPGLLFLNACSTLAPTTTDASMGHVDFGALEPVLASTIPHIAGTLWDVKPPSVQFVRAFYAAIAEGESPIDAIHVARMSVAGILAWAGTYPAYVLHACRFT